MLRTSMEALFNFLHSFIMRIMQSGPLESCKIGFHQVELRGIGGRPVDVYPSTNSGREFPECLFVGAKIIHDQVDATPGPGRNHVLQPESTATFGRFCGKSFTNGPTGVRVKCAEPQQSPVSFITSWSKLGPPAPCFTSPRDCLQRAHFVKADNLPPSGTMPVNLNYSVFFTSNSGSLLSHHV